MKRVIDYEKLSTPGIILGSTDTLNIISVLIRGADIGVHEGLADGIEAMASTKFPSHCFVTYTENDLVMGMELTFPNIRKFDLSEIHMSNLANHLVFAAMPPCLIDNDELQKKSLKWMKKRFAEDIPYNVLGLFKFLNNDIPNQPGHEYCAQFASLYLKYLADETKSFTIPENWQVGTKEWKVSPYDLQNWFMDMRWNISWTKMVEDDYGREEIITDDRE